MKHLLLALLLTGCADSVQEIECTDRDDLNRGGSVHVIGTAERGVVVDVVWCGDDDSATGFTCEDQGAWFDGEDLVTSCPTVGDDEDRGSLWVWDGR